METKFIAAADLPQPHAVGRPPHPVDVKFAADVRNKPEEWAIYPLTARYPNGNPKDRRDFDRMVNLVRKRVTNRTNAFRAGKGRYETRTDRTNGKLFIRYTED